MKGKSEKGNHYVMLKRFGMLEINKMVPAHKHVNGLWHIYFKGDWHEVPERDIDLSTFPTDRTGKKFFATLRGDEYVYGRLQADPKEGEKKNEIKK